MPDPQQLADIAAAHTDAAAELEAAVAAEVTGDTEERFIELAATALAAWTAASAGLGAAAVAPEALRRLLATLRAAVRRILTPLGPRARTALSDALAGAVLLGADQHAEFVQAATGRRAAAPPTRPTRALRALADQVEALVEERRDRALRMLQPRRASTWGQILTGIGTARGAVSVVRAHAAWVIGTAVNEGLAAGIDALGARRMWVAERDACTGCLAYAGRTAAVREPFPGGLDWDPHQRRPDAPGLDAPPLHPHCRCRIVPWRDSWATGLPGLLREQALVAVATGRAGPTESRAARIRAAAALLDSGEQLPPAARRAAQQAARTGRFPRTRAA